MKLESVNENGNESGLRFGGTSSSIVLVAVLVDRTWTILEGKPSSKGFARHLLGSTVDVPNVVCHAILDCQAGLRKLFGKGA